MDDKLLTFMLEGFRKPIIQEKDPYFYICGGRYSYDEIEAMSLQEFCVRRNSSIPKHLYKYYSDSKVIDDGIEHNYSREALVNGTVYMHNVQDFDDNYDCLLSVTYDDFVRARLLSYAKILGIKQAEDSNVNMLMCKIADNLYRQVSAGKTINDIIEIINSKFNSEKVKLQHEVFLRKVFVTTIENKNRADCWQIALRSSLDYEYKNVINYADNFRIACFSETPYLVDMWSRQYAGNHHGFCVEYQMPDRCDANDKRILDLFPVIYSDNRKNLIDSCIDELENEITLQYLENIYKYGLLAKSKTLWMQQREWRLILAGNMQESNYLCNFYPITKVFLGQKMGLDERKEIIEICEQKGIPYVGVKPMSFDYEMTECPGNCKDCVSINDKCS